MRQILDRIADKWSLLVIALLEKRTLRFTELRKRIDGISQRMLTTTLRQLEHEAGADRADSLSYCSAKG
ncbi:DNA-binding HxlR family transcriptional regulator [Rhizobium sp. BK196]|uniref:winged helix-turn-helix transcriptional regulator n=1 Tax=Rhizobium sp. BK196 TaxID=2587073 RepID=UPI0018115A45|nr:DNA-binding HxlR family transcriptional regulator [Rhizobium sp. BK196]